MKLKLTLACLFLLLAHICPAQEGREWTFENPAPQPAKGKPRPPERVVCWLPKDCKHVRGVVVAHPMIKALALDARFRKVAADEGLGTVMGAAVFGPSGKETIERLDKLFAEWAEKSGHPELKGAAVFTGGLSASVLWARNVGYGAPDRCFGILHVAGGNLHHALNDESKSLSGVPFMAVNGQFESCGPEGGIRPHLGVETQWYLMGDTMLERRKQDPNNLMTLVVIPSKGHTAWNMELAALFLRKAAQYRLPKEKRDGSTPAKCVALKAEDGWLTDRDVKHPKHEPAAYADYKGDKTEAFWHFDKEMALAVCKYHQDGIRPGQEPTLIRPPGLFEELWPLGAPMELKLKGDAPDEDAAAVRQWLDAKTQKRLGDPVARRLAEGFAAAIRKDKDGVALDVRAFRDHCQRVCYAYDDAFRAIELAIEKPQLTADCKARLTDHFAEELLVLWPVGQSLPVLPIRAIQAQIALLPGDSKPETLRARLADGASQRAALEKLYGALPAAEPEGLDKLLEALRTKDAAAGWSAVDELAKLGRPAIPSLVRAMDYAGPPVDFRAAAALGRMGKTAESALPDVRRAASSGGGASETAAMVSVKAIQAVAEIEGAATGTIPSPKSGVPE